MLLPQAPAAPRPLHYLPACSNLPECFSRGSLQHQDNCQEIHLQLKPGPVRGTCSAWSESCLPSLIPSAAVARGDCTRQTQVCPTATHVHCSQRPVVTRQSPHHSHLGNTLRLLSTMSLSGGPGLSLRPPSLFQVMN